ncbi:hypothetical protein AB3X31_25730 [Raoultella terrigena]|uniref:hypothetical protein n=1 Tax=Raoultella terrigena TaxID=577 RepID=UPI00349FB963
MSQQLSQLRHAFLRGRTWYTNFKMNASSRYIRLSLGTDSLKQASLIMNQVMPFIPLVQNGTMALEEFKLKLQGYRAATKQDFDNYLLRALQSDVAEVKRLPQLGQYHRAIFPESSLSPTATVEEAKRGSEVHLNRMYSGDDLSAREVLSALKMQKLEFSSEDLPRVNEVAGELDMSRATVQQAYSAFYSGDLPRYRQLLETLQLQLKDAEQKTIPPEQKSLPVDVEESSSTEGNAIPLSEAWDMYVKEKGKKWSRAVAGENNRFYEVLAHVVGDRDLLPVD